MNIILENSAQVAWHTDMAATLSALGVSPLDYDWYVSDFETNVPVPCLSEGDAWLTGQQLADVIAEPVQFIWAVFSAVPAGERSEFSSAPSADSNPSFWQAPEVSVQMPGAHFEVVCWDSSATLLIGVSDVQAAQFSRTYSDAKPLSSAWAGAAER